MEVDLRHVHDGNQDIADAPKSACRDARLPSGASSVMYLKAFERLPARGDVGQRPADPVIHLHDEQPECRAAEDVPPSARPEGRCGFISGPMNSDAPMRSS